MILVLSWRAKIQNDGNSIVLLLPQTHVNELEFLIFCPLFLREEKKGEKMGIGRKQDTKSKYKPTTGKIITENGNFGQWV